MYVGESRKIRDVLVLYLGLAADDSQSRARDITEYLREFRQLGVELRGVPCRRLYIGETKSLSALAYELRTFFVQVKGVYLALAAHELRHSEGLSTGGSAYIEDSVLLRGSKAHAAQLRSKSLNVEPALFEGFCCRKIAALRHKAVVHELFGSDTAQCRKKFFLCTSNRIETQICDIFFKRSRKKILRRLSAVVVRKALHKLNRSGILHG